MTTQEVSDILQSVSKMDMQKMELQDQLLFFATTLKFAESMKPLVIKYSDKLPENSTFLLKL